MFVFLGPHAPLVAKIVVTVWTSMVALGIFGAAGVVEFSGTLDDTPYNEVAAP